jgi:hypothetical protein
MLRRTLFLRRWTVAGVLLVAGGQARAQLAASSPFLPPQNAGAATPTQNAPLIFAAVIETPTDGVQYRLVDPAGKKGAWLKLNESKYLLLAIVKQ